MDYKLRRKLRSGEIYIFVLLNAVCFVFVPRGFLCEYFKDKKWKGSYDIITYH